MDSERFTEGMKVRRAVLGEAYVNRATAPVDQQAADMQRIVTESAWGSLWTRPGLTLRERSFITLAMLIALDRPHEIKIHTLGAINNGLTPEEIIEIVMHSSGYCGIPASLDAMRTVRETLAEIAAAKGA